MQFRTCMMFTSMCKSQRLLLEKMKPGGKNMSQVLALSVPSLINGGDSPYVF